MKDIPYEIWQRITTFLDSSEVKALFSVNGPLFDIAMNERYRTASIGSLSSKTCNTLKSLADKDITVRVRTLQFRPSPDTICSLYPVDNAEAPQTRSQPTKGRRISEKIRSRMKISISGSQVPPFPSTMTSQEVAEYLRKIMSQLTSLNCLLIELYTSAHLLIIKDPKPLSDLLALGWSAFGNALQTLNVKTTLEDMPFILHGPPMLKNLEKLSIHLMSAAIGQPAQNISFDAAHPLIQVHRNSLRSLTLLCVDPRINMGLLKNLSFPLLSHFAVSLFDRAYEEATVSGLYDFFKRNRGHLLDLEIFIQGSRLYDDSIIIPDVLAWKCFLLPLPRVKNLRISDFTSTQSRDSLIRYVHQFKDNLRSLTLQPAVSLDLDYVTMITEGLITASQLTSVNLIVLRLEPTLLATLAGNLPSLRKLCLDVQCIDPFPIRSAVDITEKIPEDSPLLRWHLQTLDICIFHNIPLTHRISGKAWFAALFEMLPDLCLVCGLRKEEL